jgi:hypothetical protein
MREDCRVQGALAGSRPLFSLLPPLVYGRFASLALRRITTRIRRLSLSCLSKRIPFPVWVSKKSWKARAGFLAILFTRLLVVGVFGTSFFGLFSRDSWLESPYYSGSRVRVRPHSGPPTPWFSWPIVGLRAGLRGIRRPRKAFCVLVGGRKSGF